MRALPLMFVIVAQLCPGARARADQLVSFYPLQGEGLETEELARLGRLLRHQANDLPGVIVHSRRKTVRAVGRASGGTGDCEGRLDCLVTLGELSGASHVVYGTATRERHSYRVDLKVIDVDKEKIVNRAEEQLAGSPNAIASSASGLIFTLLAPQQFNGTLIVRMLVPGARILLDDIEVGVTPMEPLTGLKPRAYSLSILLEGAAPLRRKIELAQGSTTTVKVDVRDDKLVARIEQQGATGRGAPPEEARWLAQRLMEPTASLAATPTPTTPAPSAAAPGINPTRSSAQGSRSGEEEAPLMLIGGVSLTAVGGLGAVLGGAGMLAYASGLSSAERLVDGDGVVSDPDAYDASMEQEQLYLGFGTAGLVALGVGVVALGAGIGLLVFGVVEEPPGPAGDIP